MVSEEEFYKIRGRSLNVRAISSFYLNNVTVCFCLLRSQLDGEVRTFCSSKSFVTS